MWNVSLKNLCVTDAHFDMRGTFKDNCKSATQVKMLKNVDNSRYIRNLVMKKNDDDDDDTKI